MSSLKTSPLTSTESHPRDPIFLHDLAVECFKRHGLSGEKDDVDKLILRLSEKFSPPLAESGSDCIQTLLDLTLARIHRFKEFGELRDVNPTIEHLRKLRDYSLEALNVPYHAVTTSLVEMLAAKVKEEVGDALEDINEIIDFCRDLASAISPVYLTNSSQALTRAALAAYSRGKQLEVIDQAIEYLREALGTYSSGSHQVQVSFDLSNLLTARFLVHHADENCEEAKLLLDPLTAPPSPGDPPCSYRCRAIALKKALEHAQSIASPDTGNSDATISRCRSFIDDCSSFGNLHPIVAELLLPTGQTVQGFDPLQGASAQVAHSNVDPPLCLQLRSLGELEVNECDIVQTASSLTDVREEIRRLEKNFDSSLLGTNCQQDCLKNLVRCYRTKISLTHDITDIKDAIKWIRRLLDVTGYRDSSRFVHLSMLGGYLFMAYNHTQTQKPVEDLNESINLHREVLGVENARLIHFTTIRRLIGCLSSRLELPGHRSDLGEIMELFASGGEDTYATDPSRFELACHWVDAARISKHDSLPIAYKNAMSLMQSSLVFAPTLPIQHDCLVEKRDLYAKTPLNFASHHISMGNLELAIETLEHGRALLWSEMHGLRTSLADQLRTADPDLAKKIAATNKELEKLTTSTWSDGGGVVDGRFECDKEVLQYDDLVARQQRSLKERDALISQIRDLPGFKNFLLPLPFDDLRSASSRGPVIIINHCEFRSDILIVLHDSTPSHIPTPYDFFDRANRSKVELLTARKKYGIGSENYRKTLSFVLKELYELVGRPVIERFNKPEVGVPEQSRVWWCPTSVFGHLPLHAMGPIHSSSGLRYFSDLYITSYTPTLSALIASQKPVKPLADSDIQTPPPPTLLVAQPRPFPPGAWSDEQVIRDLGLQTTSLNPANTTLATVLDGLQRHRFACIAYDGELKPERPFEASIRFFNGGYLTLLDFVRSRHPAGEFALLPGSHTAELTEESIPDEALHLSAAVQYSGYRSVIGTLWGMGDSDSVDDGQDLARAVLLSMFSGNGGEGPYYERSARALRDAVQQMRRNGVPLVRWVNYVHYGA